VSGYLDNSGREDVLSGGSRMIGIDTLTPSRCWCRRWTRRRWRRSRPTRPAVTSRTL